MAIIGIIEILFTTAFVTVQIDSIIPESDSINLNAVSPKKYFQNSIDSLAHHAYLIASNNPVKATHLADSLINISKLKGDDYGIAVGYNLKGNSFERRTENDSAFNYYFKCLNLIEHKNFPAVKSEALFNIGDLYEVTGHYDSAAIYVFSSLSIADSIFNTDLQGKNLRIVGNLMYKQSRYNDALMYYAMALESFSVNNLYQSLLARTRENIALTYLKLDSLTLADYYFNQASDIYQRISDERGKARVDLNRAMLNIRQGLLNEALERTTKALEFFKGINHHNGIAECYMTLAEAYLKQKKYHEAEQNAMHLLNELKWYEDKDLEQVAYQILEKTNYAQGNIKRAYEYQSKSKELYTSIYKESKDALITELLIRYNLKKAEQKAKLLHEQNVIDNLKIIKQKQQAMWLSLAIVLLVIIIVLVFYIFHIRQIHKVQQTRQRISSDLHDDLGSSLSAITMLSQVVRRHLTDKQDINTLEKISKSAQDALEKISEIVWSLNPKNDSLASLISYIRKYTAEYFEYSAIECRITLPQNVPPITISGEQRRNIFLVVKESMHNVIKHSNATSVDMNIALSENQLTISIHDNGNGINFSQCNTYRNGLLNMELRMKESGGSFSIENQLGTTVQLSIKIK